MPNPVLTSGFAVVAAVLGASIASFLAVVADRGFHASIAGRSRCDSCGRSLRWFETLPFISFLALRGRCRSCGVGFGWTPLLWEAAGAAVAVGISLPLLLSRGA